MRHILAPVALVALSAVASAQLAPQEAWGTAEGDNPISFAAQLSERTTRYAGPRFTSLPDIDDEFAILIGLDVAFEWA